MDSSRVSGRYILGRAPVLDARFATRRAGTRRSMKDEQELEDEARRSREETERLRRESGLDDGGGGESDDDDAES